MIVIVYRFSCSTGHSMQFFAVTSENLRDKMKNEEPKNQNTSTGMKEILIFI